MAVKPGYKQTEMGVIPEDWESCNLGNYVSLRRGHDLTERERRPGDIPVMGSAGQNGFHDTVLAEGPGVVVGRSGASYGQVHFIEQGYWPHNTVLYVTDFHGNDQLFTYYFLKALDFSRYNSGGAQQSLNRNFIYPIPVSVPPLSEQLAITATLSDMDTLINALDRLIAKKRDLKQAAMQQLLTGKQRLPGFCQRLGYKETEVGIIPEDWGSISLEPISAFITKGATPTTYGFGWKQDGILFLRSECVSKQGLDLAQSMFISPKAHEVLKRSEVRGGDILITITGNVGRVVHLDNDFGSANINQHIARIRIIDENVDTRYVFHFLSQPSIKKYYGSITTGQAYPQISLRQVRETKVPLPSIKEQAAIAIVLSDMDAEIAALEQRRDKTKALKQGMMQELLTGRIRLV